MTVDRLHSEKKIINAIVFPPQFLCLKNIRTFLSACCETFGMRKSELFEAFDLFDVRDFGKVRIVCFLINSLNRVLGAEPESCIW